MERLLLLVVGLLVVYSIAVTHRVGVLEGQSTAFASVSEQVDRGTLDLKGE